MTDTEREILEHLRIVKNILRKDTDNNGGGLYIYINVGNGEEYISFFNSYWAKSAISYSEFDEVDKNDTKSKRSDDSNASVYSDTFMSAALEEI